MIEKNISDIMEGHDKVDFYIAIIDALSKQIPKKPKVHSLSIRKPISSVRYICPTCKEHISRTAYCSSCGQRLNWGE